MVVKFSGSVIVPAGAGGFKTKNATPSGGTDPFFSNVSLLLHMDGSNGGSTFTDSSSVGTTPTLLGSVHPITSTAQVKFGTASGFFATGSSTSWLNFGSNAAYAVGSNDWTVECWIYRPAAATGDYSAILSTAYNTGANGINVRIHSDNKLNAFVGQGTSPSPSPSGLHASTVLTADTWHYVAATYTNADTTLRLYLDGVLDGSFASINKTPSSSELLVGRLYIDDGFAQDSGNGYIDDLRFTNGVARYTGSTMTVPTAAHPDS